MFNITKNQNNPPNVRKRCHRHKTPDIIYSQSGEKYTFANAPELNREIEASYSNDKDLNNNDQNDNRKTTEKETFPDVLKL